MKCKGRTDHLEVLLMSEKIGRLPDGVLDSVRAQLDCSEVFDKIMARKLVKVVSLCVAISRTWKCRWTVCEVVLKNIHEQDRAEI
jgi:hypothetical protein